jgi:hypothetical protein
MADVPLLLASCPHRLATSSCQPLTADFSWYLPSAVSSQAEGTNCHLSTDSLTLTQLLSNCNWSSLYSLRAEPQKTLLLLTCATWYHVFHCSITCPPGAGPRGNTTSAALLLLHYVTTITETCLSCYCLAMHLGFQQTCPTIWFGPCFVSRIVQ